MAALTRADVARPVIRKRAVQVDALGGEIIVRQMLLAELLSMGGADTPRADQVLGMLSACVLDRDGLPLFSRDEWQAWGAEHAADVAMLCAVVDELTGGDPKKTTAPS